MRRVRTPAGADLLRLPTVYPSTPSIGRTPRRSCYLQAPSLVGFVMSPGTLFHPNLMWCCRSRPFRCDSVVEANPRRATAVTGVGDLHYHPGLDLDLDPDLTITLTVKVLLNLNTDTTAATTTTPPTPASSTSVSFFVDFHQAADKLGLNVIVGPSFNGIGTSTGPFAYSILPPARPQWGPFHSHGHGRRRVGPSIRRGE
ncbi:hypothetical protein V8E36_002542 [Tilletia maclaganii]